MKITFAPIRARRSASGPDMSVKMRRNNSGLYLEITVSAAVQDRVRYVDGDRVICHFDDENKSWELERISPDRVQDGYKVFVRECAATKRGAHKNCAIVRVGCRGTDQVTAVLGARDSGAWDFLEIRDNRAVFMARE